MEELNAVGSAIASATLLQAMSTTGYAYALLNRINIQLNGFNVDIPQSSKSLIFLVTSVKECILAVAAINISACDRGLP
ncbi:hypothetical protein IQ277_15235 [Nostocales cyanobacterium LEGE 12452]|nr:hypothetical protein [Nostocales cyanobacterium LEGE 12452]